MQVSTEELLHVSEYVDAQSDAMDSMTLSDREWVRVGGRSGSLGDTQAQADVKRATKLANAEPDVRDDLIASLRARIEAGSYTVDSVSIAEMMVRRTFADSLH